jgi:hypothetical protein
MKLKGQVPLPLGRLPGYVVLVAGDRCYHLRPVHVPRTFCGKVLGADPLRDGRRQKGWGRVAEDLRCAHCARHLSRIKAER